MARKKKFPIFGAAVVVVLFVALILSGGGGLLALPGEDIYYPMFGNVKCKAAEMLDRTPFSDTTQNNQETIVQCDVDAASCEYNLDAMQLYPDDACVQIYPFNLVGVRLDTPTNNYWAVFMVDGTQHIVWSNYPDETGLQGGQEMVFTVQEFNPFDPVQPLCFGWDEVTLPFKSSQMFLVYADPLNGVDWEQPGCRRTQVLDLLQSEGMDVLDDKSGALGPNDEEIQESPDAIEPSDLPVTLPLDQSFEFFSHYEKLNIIGRVTQLDGNEVFCRAAPDGNWAYPIKTEEGFKYADAEHRVGIECCMDDYISCPDASNGDPQFCGLDLRCSSTPTCDIGHPCRGQSVCEERGSGQHWTLDETCDYRNGDTGVCQKENEKQVECCVNYDCQTGERCNGEYKCVDKDNIRDCPQGMCCDADKVGSPYTTTRECSAGMECCLDDAYSGVCKTSCDGEGEEEEEFDPSNCDGDCDEEWDKKQCIEVVGITLPVCSYDEDKACPNDCKECKFPKVLSGWGENDDNKKAYTCESWGGLDENTLIILIGGTLALVVLYILYKRKATGSMGSGGLRSIGLGDL